MTTLETDYLVIGAGASGMAFTDSLVAESDRDVVLADRRDRPGGHWLEAYPFVRLHMPSASYGVNSRQLGAGAIVAHGRDAGLYERATVSEICDYYQRVLDETLLPSGQVRFFGMCDYLGGRGHEHQLRCRLTGRVRTVRVRRKLVDATYLAATSPATHRRSFTAAPDVRLVSPTELTRLDEAPSGYTVLGSGKTGMDTCQWLLDNGVGPERIRWVRPRDLWLVDRAWFQPATGLPAFFDGQARSLEAAARATDIPDLFARLEASGCFLRIDPTTDPRAFRGASASRGEIADLRRIEDILRHGRVRALRPGGMEFADGTVVPGEPDRVYVDCTADGAPRRDARPVCTAERITLQSVVMTAPPFSAALIAFVEATRDDDVTKNRLCPANPYPDAAADWIANFYLTYRARTAWDREPDLKSWLRGARLNRASGAGAYRDDPVMADAQQRIAANVTPALANLELLLERTEAHRTDSERTTARLARSGVPALAAAAT